MTGDQPTSPPYTRRPWDEVLQEFAEQTGRPIWPVTRVTPSYVARMRANKVRRETAEGKTAS